jgi:hypothetical protein
MDWSLQRRLESARIHRPRIIADTATEAAAHRPNESNGKIAALANSAGVYRVFLDFRVIHYF